MYSSKYKANKKFHRKKNSFKNNKGLYGGIIRFIKLVVIIAAIVPLFYLIDKGYGFINHFLDVSRWDNYLEVRSVRVKGNNFITRDELAPYLQMQKVQGHNILTVDIKDIASRVRNYPWIKDVSVRREFPDTILVEISERTPAVYVNDHGNLYLADEEGVLLGDKTENLLSLPVVYGIDLSKMNIGNRGPVEGLSAAIEVRRELTSIPWIDLSTTGIEVEERDQIVLHLKGYRIKLGRGGYREKLQRFYGITKNLQEKGIPYKEVDLRFDNQIIIKTIKII